MHAFSLFLIHSFITQLKTIWKNRDKEAEIHNP